MARFVILPRAPRRLKEGDKTRMAPAFFVSSSGHRGNFLVRVVPNVPLYILHRPRQSKMTSIFSLTSIFNPSIHSSIAVFYLGPHIHEKWKGRIETWQPRKRQRRRAKRNNSSSHQT